MVWPPFVKLISLKQRLLLNFLYVAGLNLDPETGCCVGFLCFP
jgi:hypothetical protein